MRFLAENALFYNGRTVDSTKSSLKPLQAGFGIYQTKPEMSSGLIWHMQNQARKKIRLDLAYAESSLKTFQA